MTSRPQTEIKIGPKNQKKISFYVTLDLHAKNLGILMGWTMDNTKMKTKTVTCSSETYRETGKAKTEDTIKSTVCSSFCLIKSWSNYIPTMTALKKRDTF